jgi:hypothetical protein
VLRASSALQRPVTAAAAGAPVRIGGSACAPALLATTAIAAPASHLIAMLFMSALPPESLKLDRTPRNT